MSVERYLEAHSLLTRDITRLKTCLNTLKEQGIEEPTEGQLKTLLTDALSKAGLSPKTIADYLSTARKYYRWKRKQKGDPNQMELPFNDPKDEQSAVEPQVPIETASSETPEPLDPAESAESTESLASDQQAESPEPEPEPSVTKPRRGRKPKADKGKRIQVSAYLDEPTYEALKGISFIGRQDVASILGRLIQGFIADNESALKKYHEYLSIPETLKF